MQLERLADAAHFRRVEQLHRRAFGWVRQDYIPLGIHVVDPSHAAGFRYDDWLNPEPLLDMQIRFLIDTLRVGSDVLPVVAINHTGDALLPSMFGAKLHMPRDTSATLQDVGPTPLPMLDDIEQAESLPLPSMTSGIMPQLETIVTCYRRHLPAWVHVIAPMPMGPLSTAMELRGSGMLVELVDQPAACAKLISLCAELQSRVTNRFYEVLGSRPDEGHITNFAVASPGVRLGDDSICHLSGEMIERFCAPAYSRVNRRCGGVGHVHFCSLADSRFEHIYPALTNMAEVSIVSSQFAFEYYEAHLEELRGRLAVESFYGDALRYCIERFGSFAAWASQFVPRYKDESGLVLYCQVDSVDEGREIWARWQEAHGA